jgi:hypothetical protein
LNRMRANPVTETERELLDKVLLARPKSRDPRLISQQRGRDQLVENFNGADIVLPDVHGFLQSPILAERTGRSGRDRRSSAARESNAILKFLAAGLGRDT